MEHPPWMLRFTGAVKVHRVSPLSASRASQRQPGYPGKMIYTHVFSTSMFVYRRIYQNISKHIYIYTHTYLCVCVMAHNMAHNITIYVCYYIYLLYEYGSQLTIVVDSTLWTPHWAQCCPIGHGGPLSQSQSSFYDSGKANVLTSTRIITWNQWNRHGPGDQIQP